MKRKQIDWEEVNRLALLITLFVLVTTGLGAILWLISPILAILSVYLFLGLGGLKK